MKAKRIIIIYKDSNFESTARTEKLFVSIVNELVSSGRELKYVNKNTATFEDGTRVSKFAFGRELLGVRATELYIDEDIAKLENGHRYIENALTPIVVPEGNYSTLDVRGKKKDRVLIYSDNSVKKYFEE